MNRRENVGKQFVYYARMGGNKRRKHYRKKIEKSGPNLAQP